MPIFLAGLKNKKLVQKIIQTTFFLSTQSGLSIGVCFKVSLKIYFISALKEFHILNKKLKFKKFLFVLIKKGLIKIFKKSAQKSHKIK
jgi:hypothetical protein